MITATGIQPGPLTDQFGRSPLHGLRNVQQARDRAWAANRLAGVPMLQVRAIAAADPGQLPDIGVAGPTQWSALIAEARRLVAIEAT